MQQMQNIRRSGTNNRGGSFDNATVIAVWNKAKVVPGYDQNRYRKDSCGKFICLTDYGKTSQYGWEVDHIMPVASGGSDQLINLQPLYWENNRYKGDNWPNWSCKVTS